eukprot:SAG31_NODE_20624_length_569_cov_1.082979_1_plen_103_part_01
MLAAPPSSVLGGVALLVALAATAQRTAGQNWGIVLPPPPPSPPTVDDPCAGGTGAIFQDSGTIVGVYEDNFECLWTLSCSASSAIATVTFSAFDMETNCEYLR